MCRKKGVKNYFIYRYTSIYACVCILKNKVREKKDITHTHYRGGGLRRQCI